MASAESVPAGESAPPTVVDPSLLSLGLDIAENGLPQCAGPLHPRSIPDGSEQVPDTLFECGRLIMLEPDVYEKAKLTFVSCAKWALGGMRLLPEPAGDESSISPPDSPARPDYVEMVPPGKLSSGGKKGMVHSIVHAESYAIDLSWDIILRYGQVDGKPSMPEDYYTDWLRVALDEAKHFSMWAQRLVDLGSGYGELKGHDGLWQSATETAGDLMSRLVIVHMVHEARGLDVTPNMLKKLAKSSDSASETILRANYAEEITHVGAGSKWFVHEAKRRQHDPQQLPALFKGYVKQFFKGALKPPFNAHARGCAGMPPAWYEPEPTAVAEAVPAA